MKAEITIARLLSAVLHPLIIPTLGMIILFNLDSYVAYSIPGQAKRFILVLVFVNTSIAPLLTIFLLKKVRLIEDVLLDRRSDRLLPLLFAAFYMFLTYYLLRKIPMPSVIYFYIIGAALLVVVCFIITMRWKISIHMTSIGGLSGFLIVSSWLLNVNLTIMILASILLSGLLGSSRVRLNAHTPAQVYAGYLLGAGGMLLLFAYLRI